jgi:hypothetical protein
MADTYTVNYNFKMEVLETVDLGLDLASNPEITHETTEVKGTLTASSSVPISKFFTDTTAAMTAAETAILDLTALVRDNLPNVDMTGLKVNLVKLFAPTTNHSSSSMMVKIAAASAYNLFGEDAAGADQVTLFPGDCVAMYAPETRAAVATDEKQVLITCVGGSAVLQVMIGAGVT